LQVINVLGDTAVRAGWQD